MMRLLLIAGATAAVAGSPTARENDVNTEVPRARDGDIAIAQELCAARKAGTLAAYDLFIARHPGHFLIEAAKRERELLAAKKRRR